MESAQMENKPNVAWNAVKSTTLTTAAQLAKSQPGFTYGGIQHLLTKKGAELEAAGVAIRFGRRILLDEARLIEWLRAGHGRQIAGGKGERRGARSAA